MDSLDIKKASFEKAKLAFEAKQKALEEALAKSEAKAKAEAEKTSIKARYEKAVEQAKKAVEQAKKQESKALANLEFKQSFIDSFGDGIQPDLKLKFEKIAELERAQDVAELKKTMVEDLTKVYTELGSKNIETFANDHIEAQGFKIEKTETSLSKSKKALAEFKDQAIAENVVIHEGSAEFNALNSDSRKAIKMACRVMALDFAQVKKSFKKDMATFEGKGAKTICTLTVPAEIVF
jgi:hypothetical protein